MASLDKAFYKIPARLAQAEFISKIDNYKEVSQVLDTNHKLIYCFLLSMFEYHKTQNKPTKMSYEYMGLKCGISESTVKRKVKDLVKFGIIAYTSERSRSGENSPCLYTKVVNVIGNDNYKLHNPRLVSFFNDRKLRNAYVQALFEDNPIDKSWTSEQAKYYWTNKHYELFSGVYLKGDKTSGVLYDNKVDFKMEHNLKDSDFELLFDMRREEQEDNIDGENECCTFTLDTNTDF